MTNIAQFTQQLADFGASSFTIGTENTPEPARRNLFLIPVPGTRRVFTNFPTDWDVEQFLARNTETTSRWLGLSLVGWFDVLQAAWVLEIDFLTPEASRAKEFAKVIKSQIIDL